MAKILLGKVIPHLGTPHGHHQLHRDQEINYFTGQVFDRSMVFGRFYAFIGLLPSTSGLVECTNDIIKTKLEKWVETLQIPWLKELHQSF